MSDNLVIALSFILLAAICLVGGFLTLARLKTVAGGPTEIEIPILGKVKTDYPIIAMMFFGVVFGFFAYNLWLPNRVDQVDFAGRVVIDREALKDVSSVVVGVTTSPWTMTATPLADGTMSLTIPVPANWGNYTAYAFAHGRGGVRPAVIGLRREEPKFELDLKP